MQQQNELFKMSHRKIDLKFRLIIKGKPKLLSIQKKQFAESM
jgi:hypothetical protein